MPRLSELDANLALPSGTRHRNLGRSSNRKAREAERLRTKTSNQYAVPRLSEPVKATDEQRSLDRVPISTAKVILDLKEPVLPHVSNINLAENLSRSPPTIISGEVDQPSEEPVKTAVKEDRATSVSQDVTVSDRPTKPATSNDLKGKATLQETTKPTIDVQHILRNLLNQWLLHHLEVGPEHFEWIRRNLRVTAIEQVYNHPHVQEFLELALKFGPGTSHHDLGLYDADKFDESKTAIAHGIRVSKSDHAITAVVIPGLTFDDEEDAEWKSMVEEACKTPPAELDLETLLMETENIMICHEFAGHLTADELAEVVVLGEGDLIRMLDVISEMYE